MKFYFQNVMFLDEDKNLRIEPEEFFRQVTFKWLVEGEILVSHIWKYHHLL